MLAVKKSFEGIYPPNCPLNYAPDANIMLQVICPNNANDDELSLL